MAIQPAPDDFERDVDALLRDPDVQQELESLRRERVEGRAVYYTHDEVRQRLGLGSSVTGLDHSA